MINCKDAMLMTIKVYSMIPGKQIMIISQSFNGFLEESMNTQVVAFNLILTRKKTHHSYVKSFTIYVILILIVLRKNHIAEKCKGASAVTGFVCLCALQM